MENRAYALITGVFVLAMLAALIAGGWWFSDSGRNRVPYLVVSEDSVAGLNPYATVRYRGVEVGQVTRIEFADDDSGEIHVTLELDRDTPVTEHTVASLSPQGLMGRTVVDLEDAQPGGRQLTSEAGDPARIPLEGEVQNLEQAMARTAARLAELADRMAILFNEDNRRHLAATLQNFEQASAVAPRLMRELEQTLPEVRETLDGSDETLARMNRILAELERLGQTGSASTLPRLEQLLEEWESLARRLEENPGAVLFAPQPRPGPGEPGYSSPQE